MQFGDIERNDAEPFCLDACASSRKRRREEHRTVESECVTRVRLGQINVHPFEAGKWCWIKPRAIGQKNIPAKMRDGRFQVKTTCDRHRDHFVSVRLHDRAQLADALFVGACGQPDKQFSIDAQNVATFDGAGQVDCFNLPKRLDRPGE